MLKVFPLGRVLAGIGHAWLAAPAGLTIFALLLWIDLLRTKETLRSRESREAMFLVALAGEREKNGCPDAVVEIARACLQPQPTSRFPVRRQAKQTKTHTEAG